MKCRICEFELEDHAWKYCIKDGKGYPFPFRAKGRQVEAVPMDEEVSYSLEAGGVYRFSLLDNGHYGFIDKPEIVEVPEEVAARCEHTGLVFYVDGDHVAEFVDPVTSEHYGQPIGPAPMPEESDVNP